MKKNYLVLQPTSWAHTMEANKILVDEESHVYDYAGNTISGHYTLVEITNGKREELIGMGMRVTVVEPPEAYWGVFYHAPTEPKECVGVFRTNTTSTSTRAQNLAIEDFGRRFGPTTGQTGRIITLNMAAYAQYTLEAISREEYDKYVEQDVLVERSV